MHWHDIAYAVKCVASRFLGMFYHPFVPAPTGMPLLQAVGSRHVLLVPPEHALGGQLAPFPVVHPYDTYSAVGMAATASPALDTQAVAAAEELWPAMTQARALQFNLP
eukprot:357516-Chlamydomonas_euryale.AAC.21